MTQEGMEMENNTNIPYIAYEATMARFERTIKRLWIALVLVLLALIGTNIGWMFLV